ncbi:MAG: PhoD-like phosphatase N-terminal domain-containing protein, partial [Proteobacteria bacterium]|nr:PhoD-like phosphatase N-terminal domain-containing protein [Pseudomonadota bacterium]
MLLVPHRRALLGGLAATVAAPALVRAQSVSETPFTLGVASGDPAPDGFVLWTRLAPRPLELHSGMPMTKQAVAWEVATDERFANIVAHGEEIARPELGHSVHAEITSLQPARPYFYRFHLGGATSPVGRTRTLPTPGATLQHLRFIAGGCNNYEAGFFTAYRRLSEEPDVDFFWHYGDYIYEGSGLRRGP